MQLVLDDVRVEGRRGSLLELGHFALGAGECVLMAAEPGQGHTALALVLTGRLSPYAGSVRLVRDDGTQTTKRRELRRASAVVDLPAISAPDDAVRVGTVVTEDLALARRRTLPGATRRWVGAHQLTQQRPQRADALDGPARTAVLTALAAERRRVRFLVITLPDRHGGEPAHWWAIAQSYAAVGYAVLVQCGRSAARDLGADLPPSRGDRDLRATPTEVLRTRPTTPRRPAVEAPSEREPESTWLFGRQSGGGRRPSRWPRPVDPRQTRQTPAPQETPPPPPPTEPPPAPPTRPPPTQPPPPPPPQEPPEPPATPGREQDR